MANSHDKHILVDKALLVVMSGMPIGKTMAVDDLIQKAKAFIDEHDLWLDDGSTQDKKSLEKMIIRLSPALKHVLKIDVDHDVSMTFRDFLELATR